MPVPLEVFADNASAAIAVNGYQGGSATADAPATGTAETWTFTSLVPFPAVLAGATQFHIADQAAPSEPIAVISTSGATAVVIRGADGTTPVTHAAGATFVQVTTAGALALMQLQPWQFHVKAYGAKGDGQIVTDGAMTSGSHTLTCATSTPFKVTDVGKSILVSCAGGGAYTHLATTISGYTSSSVVTLTAAATSTIAGGITGFATDDTAAIRAALAAAYAYATSAVNQGSYAEVLHDACIYGVGSAPVVGGATLGNAQIPLPIASGTAEKAIIMFTGQTKTFDQSLIFWNQLVPESSGSVLMCLSTAGTNDGTYGPSSMIGGPFDGYGADLGLFSNLMPVIDGIQLLMPYNSTIGGFDFFGMAEAVVVNGSAMTMSVVQYSAPTSPPFPNMSTYSNISNAYTWGLRMPCTGNNDRCDVFSWSCEGLAYGVGPSEHGFIQVCRCIYNIIGIEAYSGNNATMPHSMYIAYASVEGANYGISFFDGSTINIECAVLDTETTNNNVYDASSRGVGNIGLRCAQGYFTYYLNGGLYITCNLLDNAAITGVVPVTVTHYPAAPATTVAQVNAFWRPAFVYVTSTAAITAAKISNNAGTLTTIAGLTTAAAGTVMIPVPSGRSYSVTTTGTITTQWVLM